MIREFNEQWEKDYVRKTAETLEAQAVRRQSAAEKNAQRDDIDEAIGEGGGDEEEDGESEDDNEDGHGGGGAAKRSGTRRRKLCSFYFRTGAVVRTTTDNGRNVNAQCPVGGHIDCKKILRATISRWDLTTGIMSQSSSPILKWSLHGLEKFLRTTYSGRSERLGWTSQAS